jgi:hypothetical protein
MKTISRFPAAWVYLAQSFITAAEVLRSGCCDAFLILRG